MASVHVTVYFSTVILSDEELLIADCCSVLCYINDNGQLIVPNEQEGMGEQVTNTGFTIETISNNAVNEGSIWGEKKQFQVSLCKGTETVYIGTWSPEQVFVS